MIFSHSSIRFMTLVAANSQDLKDSFVGSSCNSFSSFHDMNVPRMLLSFLFFNHSMNESFFFLVRATATAWCILMALLKCFPFIIWSTDSSLIILDSIIKPFKQPSAKRLPMTLRNIQQAWNPPILKFIKPRRLSFPFFIKIFKTFEYIAWSKTKSATLRLSASALALHWSEISWTTSYLDKISFIDGRYPIAKESLWFWGDARWWNPFQDENFCSEVLWSWVMCSFN